ncbi:MAG: DUF2752 domain-containing protein, partial [Pirellulales bacterium]|nr:DUF2752 domain-containing protein [Pirellulales bacterium]
ILMHRILPAVLVLMVVTGVVVLRRSEPTEQSWYPKCMFHSWTGLHCPGCGATRALHALAHGRLSAAIGFNPLLVLGGPVLVVLVVWARRRQQLYGVVTPRLAWMSFALIMVYFVARNVPSPTRSWLAPGREVWLPTSDPAPHPMKDFPGND